MLYDIPQKFNIAGPVIRSVSSRFWKYDDVQNLLSLSGEKISFSWKNDE